MKCISFSIRLLLLAGLCVQASAQKLKPRDEVFLEDLSRRSFAFFRDQVDPKTGLALDRAPATGANYATSKNRIASIASTGFGLSALCIASERKWMPRAEARERVRTTLRFFADQAVHEHGWFYHFVNAETGSREWKCELSSIDTTLLLAGVLTARQYFRSDPEIVRLASKIYERVDYPWMLDGHEYLLSHGWHPETGFIKNRWDGYSEHTMLYLMAIGSPTHPIKPAAWYAWKRDWVSYGDYKYLSDGAPLFTHQYSHAWVDYRGRRENREPGVDYFENSIQATRAHRQFCLDLAKEFPGYKEDFWGITASDSVKGYVAWGGPPRHSAIDGSIVPCAAGGSLMFTPELSIPALRAMRENFGAKVYLRYGFVDAFHPTNGWGNPDVIGIDVGITLLAAENLRSGKVWTWFMANPEIPRALDLVGLMKKGN